MKCTCIATYAKEAVVAQVILCIWAFPDLIAFTSFSTELGDVKICLNAYELMNEQMKVKESSELPKRGAGFWKDRSMDPWDCTLDSRTPEVAIDHLQWSIRH